ncbi:MAG: methyltransferase domain-containing protein [Acidobacteriota bacterium]|nr:methyltransferase domain-containing protein [Acidobacteriota bacterium]
MSTTLRAPVPVELRSVTGRDRDLFDRIAERYAAKDLRPASRLARRTRLEQTLRVVPQLDRPAIVELGCGAGFAADYLVGSYDTYLGIDHSASLIELARSLNSFSGARFEVADVHDLSADASADVVLMIGVLHHLEDPRGAMAAAVGLLRPGGWLVVNEPQASNPLIGLARRARKTVDGDYSSDQREMTPAELSGLLSGAGLRETRIAAQGLLSTPFAEVVMRPEWAARPAAALACRLDRSLERLLGRALRPFAWNVVAAGQRPAER